MTTQTQSNLQTAPANPPRIGFALSTMERTELTRQILPGLDCGGFDLIWCDGSRTPEGRAFASREHFKNTPLVEIHHDVRGGPDAAIQYSLKRLLALGYDYVGLIENDIQLKPGWLAAMKNAWQAAEKDGFTVGAVTARSAASRVLTRTSNYVATWNLGAGMALFSRAGAEAVLADYQLASAKKIHEFYQSRLGVDLKDAWELFMNQPDRGLGADWHYAPSMLKSGMVSLGVMPNHAENIDVDFEEVCGTRFVRSLDQPLPAHCLPPDELLARITQNNVAPAKPVAIGKPRVAGDLCKDKDLTGVQDNSEFEHFLREIIRQARPEFIVETGTYLGQGTTRIISSALKENNLTAATFYSLECNPEHHRQALANLEKSGLLPFVKPLLGVSVPRSLLPDAAAIREETIEKARGDIFVDHQEEKRIELYLSETNRPNLAEDLLGRCLRECAGKPGLLLLDSAGHMGNVEFNYVLKLLRGPCYIALDDIRHVKHARSVEQMKADPRFEMLAVTEEKFGSCLARFTPAAADLPVNETRRILFVRTDSIGDAVLASGMIEPLRKQYPLAKLAVLCQQHVAELFTACSFVDSVICYDRKQIDIPAERQQILAEIAEYKPDLILNSVHMRDVLSDDLTLGFREARHVAIAGDLSNNTATNRDRAAGRYETIIPSPGEHKPELARHEDFLRGLGVEVSGLQPAVWTTAEDEALAADFFKNEKLDPQRTLALAPFTQHAIKDYPGFAAALKDFAGWNILLLGGAEAWERCELLAKQLPGNVQNLAGGTTLRQMAAIIRRCKILVGSDSCASHLACAVGVPNVVLVGGGHYGLFLPYSPLTSTVSLPLNCYDCNWRCPHQHAHCVKDVSTGVLTEAIRQTLAKPSDRQRVFIQSAGSWTGGTKLPAWQRPDPFLNGMNVEIIEISPATTVNKTPTGGQPPVHHARNVITPEVIHKNGNRAFHNSTNQLGKNESTRIMKELTHAELEAIKAVSWFHRIPIGLVQGEIFYTPGVVKHGPDGSDFATERFGLPPDLTGKTVLDIGAWDGFFSFEAERRNAALVVASDMALTTPDKNRLECGNWGANKGFRRAQHILGSKVRFIESSIFKVDEAIRQSAMNSSGDLSEIAYPLTYDITFCFGVLYHLTEPFLALQKLAAVTEGMALVETAITAGNSVSMEFRPGFDKDDSNWWYPTIPCLQAMLLRAGFARTELVYNLDDIRATVAAYK